MSMIEISDSVATRRIPASSLPDTLRIELEAADDPRVIVPQGVAVVRRESPTRSLQRTTTESGEPV